jgi:hypothetical protein
MDTFYWKELPKIQEDVGRRKERGEGREERRGRKKEVETQAQTVLTLGLDQISKFVYRLDGPLGEGNV